MLSLIALLPFGSGLIMLDPDRAMILGLASLSIMILPMAMLFAWPEIRRGPVAGRTDRDADRTHPRASVLLAFTRAPHAGFSLMTLQFWLGALIAGRAIQLAIRTYGPGVAQAALIALLVAGPLYAVAIC